MIGMRMAPPLLCALAMSACAEIEFGVAVGAGGTSAGPTDAGASEGGNVGGGPSGVENCVNGVDDDDDDLVDCADSDCSAFSCVAVPEGWSGPVELRPEETACNGAFSVDVLTLRSSVIPESAICTCSCTGGITTCGSATVSLYSSGGCSGSTSNQTLVNAACEQLGDVPGADSFQAHGVSLGNLGCAVVVGAAVPAPAFVSQRLCGPPPGSGGCDDGTCAPATQVCVYAPGSVACPPGFDSPLVLFNDFTDGRSCTTGSCGCGSPTGDCGVTINVFDGFNCIGATVAAAPGDVCTDYNFLGGASAYSAEVSITPGPYSCVESGAGAPTGSVTLTDPVTVCCTP